LLAVLAVLASLGFVSFTRFIHITYSIGRIAFAPANIAPDRSFEHLRELVRIADERAIRGTFTFLLGFVLGLDQGRLVLVTAWFHSYSGQTNHALHERSLNPPSGSRPVACGTF
jgi:hypothetical protein